METGLQYVPKIDTKLYHNYFSVSHYSGLEEDYASFLCFFFFNVDRGKVIMLKKSYKIMESFQPNQRRGWRNGLSNVYMLSQKKIS